MRGSGQMQAAAWTAGEGRDDGLESDDGCDGSDVGRSDATCGPVRLVTHARQASANGQRRPKIEGTRRRAGEEQRKQ
ncbi:hypothetical protein PI125_g23989 [Phytophthora idaei]|nr:hypothetical protein PI125_g23989 [Phytophthora idaei]